MCYGAAILHAYAHRLCAMAIRHHRPSGPGISSAVLEIGISGPSWMRWLYLGCSGDFGRFWNRGILEIGLFGNRAFWRISGSNSAPPPGARRRGSRLSTNTPDCTGCKGYDTQSTQDPAHRCNGPVTQRKVVSCSLGPSAHVRLFVRRSSSALGLLVLRVLGSTAGGAGLLFTDLALVFVSRPIRGIRPVWVSGGFVLGRLG